MTKLKRSLGVDLLGAAFYAVLLGLLVLAFALVFAPGVFASGEAGIMQVVSHVGSAEIVTVQRNVTAPGGSKWLVIPRRSTVPLEGVSLVAAAVTAPTSGTATELLFKGQSVDVYQERRGQLIDYATGEVLASAEFEHDYSSGWLKAKFDTGVSVIAGKVYRIVVEPRLSGHSPVAASNDFPCDPSI